MVEVSAWAERALSTEKTLAEADNGRRKVAEKTLIVMIGTTIWVLSLCPSVPEPLVLGDGDPLY